MQVPHPGLATACPRKVLAPLKSPGTRSRHVIGVSCHIESILFSEAQPSERLRRIRQEGDDALRDSVQATRIKTPSGL